MHLATTSNAVARSLRTRARLLAHFVGRRRRASAAQIMTTRRRRRRHQKDLPRSVAAHRCRSLARSLSSLVAANFAVQRWPTLIVAVAAADGREDLPRRSSSSFDDL